MNNCSEEVIASASEVEMDPRSTVDTKVKVTSEIQINSEVGVDPNVKFAPQDFKVDPLVKVECDAKVDVPKVKVSSEVQINSEVGDHPNVKFAPPPEFKVECDAEVDDLKFKVEPLKVPEDREFDFLRVDTTGYRRSSSLKASSSPSGNQPTSHHKKAVRFADALGLDLESVRHILNANEPPVVPSSATRDLNLNTESELDRNNSKTSTITPELPCLRAWFPNPATSPDFDRQVHEKKIRLATCKLDSINMTVSGTIWVSNFTYEKTVTVRFTTNAWVTFTDVEAGYISGSGDGSTDYFQFVVELRDYFLIGSRMEFSVRLNCEGQTYWDSNNGCNYRVECCAALNRSV